MDGLILNEHTLNTSVKIHRTKERNNKSIVMGDNLAIHSWELMKQLDENKYE